MSTTILISNANNITQIQTSSKVYINHSGTLTFVLTGSGPGTWSATASFCPIYLDGSTGTVQTLTISNTAIINEQTYNTGITHYIAWVSSASGSFTLNFYGEGA